jgi:hypothetical protein
VVLICAGAVALVAAAVTFNATALRHDLLPMQTFEDATGSFETGSGADAWAVYRDGAYLVHSEGGAVAGGTATLTRTAYALRFAADVTIASGEGEIILTCNGDYEGHGFIAGTDGTAQLVRAVPDGTSTVLDEGQIPTLLPGHTYRFLIYCEPPGAMGAGRVQASIDGRTVLAGTDSGPEFPIYAAGLMAKGSPIEVRFDNAVGGLDASVT